MSLFADDAKLLRSFNNVKDCEALQLDVDKIWEMEFKFNHGKCKKIGVAEDMKMIII